VSAREISIALHGTRNGKGFLCHCPIPSHGRGHGDKNPSLSVSDGQDGKLLVKCFAGCDPRDVLAELRQRGLADAPGEKRSTRRVVSSPKPDPEPEPDERALEIWRRALPAKGTLVEQYLQHRGITLPPPPSIRFLPHVDYMPRIGFPAMVAAVQRPDRKIIAVQITYLKPDGSGKAPVESPRKTFGKLGSGAVRLGPAGLTIGIAEGVESGLSAMQIHNVPVWCGLGAWRLKNVAMPKEARWLQIMADADDAGKKATAALMTRHGLALNADYLFPDPPAKDWNDALIKEAIQCSA
jgi:putative DNA primase/helicase